ncbi:hypothetical protein CP532_0026 [Ophiocordyceps camponoti-leonardi (nom. inval.)]|nr:hypothetical protein CP532_0026 [Ophiocordyceps camponoti-leonardi (nom. inval.)]
MARRKTVLITGCSPGGIGHALAVEFHKRGCHVIATARRYHVLAELGDMGFSTLQLDVTDPESVARCRAEAGALVEGKLDVLVNNAGFAQWILAMDQDTEAVKKMYDTNVFGVMRMCKAFVDLLIPARGLIVNMSSLTSIVPSLFMTSYASSKAALNTYSDILRQELELFDVRVMVIMAGGVRTNVYNEGYFTLPAGSLYKAAQPAVDKLKREWRNALCQPAQDFATAVVSVALGGQSWPACLLGGTPDRCWKGNLSSIVWFFQLGVIPSFFGRLAIRSVFSQDLFRRQVRRARDEDSKASSS